MISRYTWLQCRGLAYITSYLCTWYPYKYKGRIVTTKFSIIHNFKRLKTKTIVFAKCRYCHCQKYIGILGKNAENWQHLKSIVECCFGILEGSLLHGKHTATYYSLTKRTKKISTTVNF